MHQTPAAPTPSDALALDPSPDMADLGAPAFDASVLGEMFNHEPLVIAAVLRTFVSSTQTSLAEIELALQARDLSAVALLAHKVKGASRMSGALVLGHCAAELERAAATGEQALADAAAQCLLRHWPALQQAVRAVSQG